MTPTMLIRVATAALVGAMFLPAQSPAEGRRPAAKATASAAERAQVRLAEVMAMLQDDTLSPEQRAEATRKLEEVMAALAAAKATSVAGQPAQAVDSAKAGKEVVVVRSSRDSSSAQDSQSSSSSTSSGSGSSSSDSAKATDESSGRGNKAEAGKGKGRARTLLVVPGAAAGSAPAPAQGPESPAPDTRAPKPPKPPKAPRAPKPPKAPRADGALPGEAPAAPPAEGSTIEVAPLAPGSFLLSTEPPEGMTEGVSVELVEPIVISEERLAEVAEPEVVQLRLQGQGLQPLVIEGTGPDGEHTLIRARMLEVRAKLDEARALAEVDLHTTMQKARLDMDLAQRDLEVAQKAMVEAQDRMKRDIDIAAATEAEAAAKDARRVLVLRALHPEAAERDAQERAVGDRATAERDVAPRQAERHVFEVRGQRPRTRAQDEEIRTLIDEMRAEMREIRALMREMRAHASAAPGAGDRLRYVDERRVETTTEAIDAAKDADRAGRPIQLRWVGEKVETTAPEAAQPAQPAQPAHPAQSAQPAQPSLPARVRWLRAKEAPKAQCEEEEEQVAPSVGVSTFPTRGAR